MTQQSSSHRSGRPWLRIFVFAVLTVAVIGAGLWMFRLPLVNFAARQFISHQNLANVDFDIRQVTADHISIANISLGADHEIRVRSVDIQPEWQGGTTVAARIVVAEPEIAARLEKGRVTIAPLDALLTRYVNHDTAGDDGTASTAGFVITELQITDPALSVQSADGAYAVTGLGSATIKNLQQIGGDLQISGNGPDFQVSGGARFSGDIGKKSGRVEIRPTGFNWRDITVQLDGSKIDLTGGADKGDINAVLKSDDGAAVSLVASADGLTGADAVNWTGNLKVTGPDLHIWAMRLGLPVPATVAQTSLTLSGSGQMPLKMPDRFDSTLLARNRLQGAIRLRDAEMPDIGRAKTMTLDFASTGNGGRIPVFEVSEFQPVPALRDKLPPDIQAQMGDRYSLGLDDLVLVIDPDRRDNINRALAGRISGNGALTTSTGRRIMIGFAEGARLHIAPKLVFLGGLQLDGALDLKTGGAHVSRLKTHGNLQFFPDTGIGISTNVEATLAALETPGLKVGGAGAKARLSGVFSFAKGLVDARLKPGLLRLGTIRMDGKTLNTGDIILNGLDGGCGYRKSRWDCDIRGAIPDGIRISRNLTAPFDEADSRIRRIDLEIRANGGAGDGFDKVQADIGLAMKQITVPGLGRADKGRLEIGLGNQVVQGSLNLPRINADRLPLEPLSLFADFRNDGGVAFISGQAGLTRAGAPPVRFRGTHRPATGSGNVDVEMTTDTLATVEPVLRQLVPDTPLQSLDGGADLKAAVRWGQRGPVDADGAFSFRDIQARLPDVEVTGARGAIVLQEIKPLTVTMPGAIEVSKVTAAGLSLTNLRLRASAADKTEKAGNQDGQPDYQLDVTEISAELLGGRIRLDPFRISSRVQGGAITGHVSTIEMAQLTDFLAIDGLAITGILNGVIPFRMLDENDIRIEDARFTGQGGGVIRFSSRAAQDALKSAGRQEIDLLLQALTNFHYDRLDMIVNKGAGSEGALTIHLQGANPDVLKGRRFNVNITVSADVGRLIDAGLALYRSSGGLLRSRLRGR